MELENWTEDDFKSLIEALKPHHGRGRLDEQVWEQVANEIGQPKDGCHEAFEEFVSTLVSTICTIAADMGLTSRSLGQPFKSFGFSQVIKQDGGGIHPWVFTPKTRRCLLLS